MVHHGHWMPDVFEDFYNDCIKEVSDYYELKRSISTNKYFI